jgi:very-short-patch-repair endonuclease
VEAVEKARLLRQRQTDAESVLWCHLRGRRLHGYKFRRQYPVGEYVVDFICLSGRLVVELDGEYHLDPDQRIYDDERSRFLRATGFNVQRFWNEEVLKNTADTLEAILQYLKNPPSLPLARLAGEGLG